MVDPSGAQEHIDDDQFFNTGTSTTTGSGFRPATSFQIASQVPLHNSGASGFASAARLPNAPTSAQGFSGFGSAAKLPLSSQPHDETGGVETSTAVAPFVPPKFSGFGRASALPILAADEWPPSPPPQQDYDSWFDTDTSTLPVDAFSFKTAKAILNVTEDTHESASQIPQLGGFTSGLSKWKAASQTSEDESLESEASVPHLPIGFTSAAHQHLGKSNWAAPSAEALARAAAKMKEWQAGFSNDEETPDGQDTENNAPAGSRPPASHTPSLQPLSRPALRTVENGSSTMQPPDTPTPARAPAKDHFTVVAGMQIKNKPFKSPLMAKPQAQRSVSAPSPFAGSPLNPARSTGFRVASGSKLPAAFSGTAAVAGLSTPAKPAPGTAAFLSPVKGAVSTFVSPVKASVPSVASPVKALGMTPRRLGVSSGPGKGKFSTPFKAGLAPGEPGRSQLEEKLKEEQARAARAVPTQIQVSNTPAKKGKERKEYRFFDLSELYMFQADDCTVC